jgi:hypothetical protein
MSKHEKQDDKDKYTGNGDDPHRPVPREDHRWQVRKARRKDKDDQCDKD